MLAGRVNSWVLLLGELLWSKPTSMPLFMMSFNLIAVGVIKKADFFRARMVWQEDEDKKKIPFN